jgi:hypothetical protein
MSWLKRFMHALTFDGELPVAPQITRVRDIEQAREEAEAHNRLLDRQRAAFEALHQKGKSLLAGYKPPEPFDSDRIDVHFRRAGQISPTEERRRRITEPRVVQSAKAPVKKVAK